MLADKSIGEISLKRYTFLEREIVHKYVFEKVLFEFSDMSENRQNLFGR